MSLFGKKDKKPKDAPAPPVVAPPPETAKPKMHDSVLKLNLPDVFAYDKNETKAKLAGKRAAHREEPGAAEVSRGSILLVESDEEVSRLIARLLQYEGYGIQKASCLAEAREIVKESPIDFVLARRVCVPLNLQTEIALRDLSAKTSVRIVDEFSELMLGQVIDYESMAQCILALSELLLSLVEGTNVGARGHSHTVTKYCRLVGQRMGMTRRELDALTLAACLHDLGSLETMRQIGEIKMGQAEFHPPDLHATLDLLANVPFPYSVNDLLSTSTESHSAAPATDGTPAIPVPLGARILRVVDSYDTLRRSNTAEMAEENILFEWMRRQSTGTFDTDVLETLIHIRKHERAISAMNIFWAAVLLVDPHPDELQLLKMRLENDDYHVMTAKTLEEALRTLRSENVTLVLTEAALERADAGFELLRTIKSDPALRHIPVVFHALSNTDAVKQALELGAEDWLAKPHNVEITAMKLQRILGRSHANPSGDTDGVHGNLRDMGLIEMVQILCAGSRSIQIFLENETLKGELSIQKGQIINARRGDLDGEAAALDLLAWKDGNFRILPLKGNPTATITVSTDSLLQQSCVRDDPAKHPTRTTTEA